MIVDFFSILIRVEKATSIAMDWDRCQEQCRIPLKAKKATALGPAPQGGPAGPL